MSWFRLGVAAALSWVALYTVSYAVWEWKNGTRLGAVACFVLCAAVLILPVVALFVR